MGTLASKQNKSSHARKSLSNLQCSRGLTARKASGQEPGTLHVQRPHWVAAAAPAGGAQLQQVSVRIPALLLSRYLTLGKL